MNQNVFQLLNAGTGSKQIICFPYLGGYANSFIDFANKLDKNIEVWAANPPGHGGNDLEAIQDIKSLIKLYYSEIQEIIKPDCILFGHSMGGIVAYFLLQHMADSKITNFADITLVLSACNPPNEFEVKRYSDLSDEQLIDHLFTYEGIPEELSQERQLLEFFTPVFRADFKILEDASRQHFIPLKIPVYLLWGENDKIVPISSAIQWSAYFINDIALIPIENGTHMFVHDSADIVAKHLQTIIHKEQKMSY